MADELISALIAHYKTILSMADEDETTIQYPPPEGHTLPPAYVEQVLMYKTPGVLELMRRLPYLLEEDQMPFELLHTARAIGYRQAKPGTGYGNCGRYAWAPIDHFNNWGNELQQKVVIQAHELPLTMYYENMGHIFIVNTLDWTGRLWSYDEAYFARNPCALHDYSDADNPAYPDPSDNPTCCPPFCAGRIGVAPVRPAADYVNEWREKFLRLEYMTRRGDPTIFTTDYYRYFFVEKAIKTFKAFGWPDAYRSRECQDAIQDLDSEPEDSSGSDSDS